MSKKSKSERQKGLLLTLEREEMIQQALRFSRKRFKRFEEIITQLYAGDDLSFSFTDRRIWKINECFEDILSRKKPGGKRLLRDVLIHLADRSELVTGEEYIQVVYNAVLFKAHWRNDLFNWKPHSKQAMGQAKELIQYLFCTYQVPDFLFVCFYETKSTPHIQWLIHIGGGGSVKALKDIPIPFTQKMRHYFLQAPAKFSIVEALRWAQVKGWKGEDRLAERIAYSWLGTRPYGQEDFWESFIQLLVNGGMFNHNKITELIDYIREAKRENESYNLKGRTLQSLLRQSDTWHNRYAGNKPNKVWTPCGIEGYLAVRKLDMVVIEELIEARSLAKEGRAMKHCVASYAFYCEKGRSAIFSMRKYSEGELLEIMATIEVSVAAQRIVQARGKANRIISGEARKYMQAWALQEKLNLGPYL